MPVKCKNPRYSVNKGVRLTYCKNKVVEAKKLKSPKSEWVNDRSGRRHLIKFKRLPNGELRAYQYNDGKDYSGEWLGKTKEEIMKNIRDNINIMVYD